ncbi:MAG: hypothetical protein KC620_09100 [Myxococcales bacterium]|nr:hypothetical protein [Myxococcales bacterium]
MSATKSTWLQFLPAALRGDPVVEGFLLAFERVLVGRLGAFRDGYPDDPIPGTEGIEERLTRVGDLLAPRPGDEDSARTPEAFLPWLEDMLAVPARAELDGETRRRFLRAALPSYRKRGTKQGLIDSLGRYLGNAQDVQIYEFEDEPHFFQVEVVVRTRSAMTLARIDRVVRALIDQLRPAHTWYSVRYLVPTMQIIDHPTEEEPGILLGVNTLIGSQ